jgi:hypothetical protein
MSEFKVRDLGEVESKSTQEVEKALLEKHEQKLQGDEKRADESMTEQPAKHEIKDEDVLSHIKNRYGREIKSLDELLAEREASPELPEDVEAFFKYKKETGRGINDFVSLNKNYDEVDEDSLLMDYYKQTEEGLDDSDISDLVESKFGYDEDLDDESSVKKQKLAKKRELNKAKKFFKEQQESYKVPLESREGTDPEALEELKSYKSKMKETADAEAVNQKKREWFTEKTDSLFTDEFKGFEFDINNKKITFKPADAAELKKNQQTPTNFINKFVGEDGFMKDIEGYHRSLAIAMNPEKFAKFFFEQGQSVATGDITSKSKNIDMSMRSAPEITNKGGMQIRSVNQDSGNGLKIRSTKRT